MTEIKKIKNIKFPVKLSTLSKEYNQLIHKPEIIQKKLLQKILNENKNTVYGKKYNFSQIKNLKDFQEKIPIITYSDIQKDIEEIHKGKQNILTKKPVVFMGTTSGSSGKPKLIPITANRKKSFKKELHLWSYFTIKKIPQLWSGKTLYLIGGEPQTIQRKAIPHASASKYLLSITPNIMRKKLAISLETWNIIDYESRLRTIAKEALQQQKINHIGFPYPLECTFLFEYIQKHWTELLQELELEKKIKTVKRLKKLKNNKPITIWPKLKAINMIKTQDNEIYLKQLFKIIGKELQTLDPGIYSTEGRLTFNLKSDKNEGYLASNVTFFEFEEKTKEGFKEPIFINKLKVGKVYRVIITTVDGLYRYNIGDLLKVVRFEKKLPIVKFVGRDKYINIQNEKTPYDLGIFAANKALKNKDVKTYTIIPSKNNYDLFVEFDQKITKRQISQIEKEFDETIKKFNKEYAKARKNKKISSPKIKLLQQGAFEKIYKKRIWELGETKAISVTTDSNQIKEITKYEA